MTNSAKRSILRWIHLVLTIPILGYIYGKPSDVAQYGDGVRYLFAPLIILSGYWMYAGFAFAIVGAMIWLGAFHLFGFGTALLSQIVLFIARKTWLAIRARRHTPKPVLSQTLQT